MEENPHFPAAPSGKPFYLTPRPPPQKKRPSETWKVCSPLARLPIHSCYFSNTAFAKQVSRRPATTQGVRSTGHSGPQLICTRRSSLGWQRRRRVQKCPWPSGPLPGAVQYLLVGRLLGGQNQSHLWKGDICRHGPLGFLQQFPGSLPFSQQGQGVQRFPGASGVG